MMPTNNAINAAQGETTDYLINDGISYHMFDRKTDLMLLDDFIHHSYEGTFGIFSNVANSGTTGLLDAPDNAHPGIYYLKTITNTTSSSSLRTSTSSLLLGGGRLICNWLVQLPTLSDGTDTFTIRCGLGDSASADFTDGVYFEYTDSVNDGKWDIKTASNSSRTTENTNNTVTAGQWDRLTIDVNADGSSAAFYVNGTQCTNSPIVSNIPTGAGRHTGFVIHMVRSAGTDARDLYIDLFSAYQKLTATR
jgi:hypothetical protein